MELGRMKLKYIVNLGLGPHFREILKCETITSKRCSISFDEKLNKAVEECEMDILFRFCDNLSSTVQVQFWNSILFFGEITDLVKNFNEGLTGDDPSKNLQNLMDWPSVNLKSLENIRKEREEAKLSKLSDIDSCDLHVIHRFFKSAC